MNRPHSPAPAPHDPATAGATPGARRLNLGVVAHVDAGKTSLTEALLHAGGAIEQAGRVDDGTTQTDTLALERRRGITIRSAVATFAIDDVTVNLVDTPGHPDFIAEVDRSLAVLDGAVLVLSAVEGVQAQTIVLYRALHRLGIPVLFFVNKIDRGGAAPEKVLEGIRSRLSTALVPLGHVRNPGTAAAEVAACAWERPAEAEQVTGLLADHDEGLLKDWLARDHPVGAQRLRAALGRLTRAGDIHPVLFGSARTGAGVRPLIEAVTELLPAAPGDDRAPAAAQVFKIERSPGGQRVCTVRMRAGTLGVRDRVSVGGGRSATVTAVEVFEPGGPVRRTRATTGQIARVRGLDGARIGDWIGCRPAAPGAAATLPEPGYETRVTAHDPARQGELHQALTELADIDPLIALRPERGAARIRIYGEVQQEFLADTLAAEYGIAVDFHDTGVVCVERPSRTGSAMLRLGDAGHLYNYTLGMTVEPAAPGAGVELVVTADLATLPLHVYGNAAGYRAAILEYLHEPLAVGPHGWRVTDVRITVTDSGYPPAGPRAAEVRRTAELVLRTALGRAGTTVCEPIDRFALEAPAGELPQVLALLGRHGAIPEATRTAGLLAVITGTVRTAEVHAVRAGLHGAAHGEGVLDSVPDHYRPVRTTGRRPR
ncbi:ribosomal protection tetracycline resistance protein [Streptomyces sp. DvalAA-14]|uniref:elongation factor G n=1 Tax=unclassified Streptomyces TaxID=2593676 RepID=UPI00081B8D9B|nr:MULTISPECIES: TetM/TetW/TetO/TetS family tetracycline resistance ribosomal protection protein [unclassified Streptomyces]MYS21864.1 GTP-binding protein [Streptomyces sp. SID4948]SCE02569.1 ribosomal protection tetracycline resistance protein [Streptomyces sp. DvalAA-14]